MEATVQHNLFKTKLSQNLVNLHKNMFKYDISLRRNIAVRGDICPSFTDQGFPHTLKKHLKSRSQARLTLHGDFTTAVFDYAPCDVQANSRAFHMRMKAFKHCKDFVVISV